MRVNDIGTCKSGYDEWQVKLCIVLVCAVGVCVCERVSERFHHTHNRQIATGVREIIFVWIICIDGCCQPRHSVIIGYMSLHVIVVAVFM